MKFWGPRKKKFVRSSDTPEFMIGKVVGAHPEFKSIPNFSAPLLVWGHWPPAISADFQTLRENCRTDLAKILSIDLGKAHLENERFWEKSYFVFLKYWPPNIFGSPRSLFELNFGGFTGVLAL